MGDKRVHKPDKDQHSEKHSREFGRRQRDTSEVDESVRHRSGHSVVEGGENEQKGEPSREGHVTPKGPMPLQNE